MAKKETKTKTKEKSTKKKPEFYSGTGRRKRAVARVWLYEGKKDFGFQVNDMPIENYFEKEEAEELYLEPFYAVGVSHPKSQFSTTIKVEGGGKSGQLGAIVLGFARALVEYDPENRPALSKRGLLTRDPREVERKKYWLRKARKAPQYSKR